MCTICTAGSDWLVDEASQLDLKRVCRSFFQWPEGGSLAGSNYILAQNTPLEYHSDDFPSFVTPVVIKRNAWIAIESYILLGVTVGEGRVSGAGAAVIKDVPPHSLVGGIPAKVIRKLVHSKDET